MTRRSDARSRRAVGAGFTPGDRNIVSRSSSARRNQSEAREPPTLRDLDPTGRCRNPQFSSVMEPRSPGRARLGRKRRHERQYGYTQKDATNEHPGPAFWCPFRVGSGLMNSPGQGHTQNEQLSRPRRLCQGLDRGPEPRCPDGGASRRALHDGPHRDSAVKARG